MADLTGDPYRSARLLLMLRRNGVTDSEILNVIESTDRAQFVSPELADLAFENCALPIGCGQTLPSPLVAGQMLQGLQLRDGESHRVLIVGAGSGYLPALAAGRVGHIVATERYQRLARRARENLAVLGIGNVEMIHADGLSGCRAHGPYDRILVAGAIERPKPELFDALAEDGLIAAPFTAAGGSELRRFAVPGTFEATPLARALPRLSEGLAAVL